MISMRRLRIGMIAGILISLAIVLPTVLLRGGSEDSGPFPFFNLNKPALAITAAEFPDPEIGISAYIKFDPAQEPLDLDALPRSLFTQVTHAGDNFVIGTFSHQKNLSGGIFSPMTVSVYADDEGWLMAYFPKTLLVAEIINKGFGNSFLEVALFVAAIEAGVPGGIGGKEDQIGYYHWAFPDATHLALGRKDPPYGNFYFAIPNQATVFDVSAAKDCSNSDAFILYGLAPTCQAAWVVTVPLMDGIPAGRVVNSSGELELELARPPDLAPEGPPFGEVQTIAFPKGEWMGVTILYSMTPVP